MSNAFLRRRYFLSRSGLAAMGVLGLSTEGFGGAQQKRKRKRKNHGKKKRKPRPGSVLELGEEDFQDLVGDEFEASNTRRHIRLKLVECRELDHHTDASNRPTHVRQEPFALLFIAPGKEQIESGIYELEHPKLGDFDLFLHEVGADQDINTVHYEVIFN